MIFLMMEALTTLTVGGVSVFVLLILLTGVIITEKENSKYDL